VPLIETGSGELYYDLCDLVPAWIDNPQTIVFHHGIAANTHIWAEWLPVLATRYRLLRFDMRGFGKSSQPPRDYRWTFDGLVDDLLKVADARAIRLALLRHHYRAGFEWFDTDLDEGRALLRRLMAAADCASDPAFRGGADPRPFAEKVRVALDDDLDVPRALDALDDLASAILSGGDHAEAPGALVELAGLIGVDLTVRARTG